MYVTQKSNMVGGAAIGAGGVIGPAYHDVGKVKHKNNCNFYSLYVTRTSSVG